MWWQILVLDLSLFTLVFICASWSSVTARSHNLSSNLVSSDPEFWLSYHDTRRKLATLDLLIQPLRWGKSPRHILASTTFEQQCQLHELATPHRSIPFHPTVLPYIPAQWLETPNTVCTMNTRWACTQPCYIAPPTPAYIWCPNLFPRHFLWKKNNNDNKINF